MLQTQSTIKLQSIVNIAMSFADIEPILNVAGDSNNPAIIIATDVMNAMCATSFPGKWNEINLPYFYTNSWQQDYALVYTPNTTVPGSYNPVSGPGPITVVTPGSSVTNLEWLERGVCIDINSTSFPKMWREVEVGRQLPTATGANWANNGAVLNPAFLANFFPNNTLYYGTWGALNNGTGSVGNNPGPGAAYQQPLGTQSQPNNPITQIQDANGNLLVLTTYGVEGSAAPVAPVSAPAGTVVSGPGATTAWTVVDPWGQGIRLFPVPSQTGRVWQMQLVGQAKPVRFTSLTQTLFPMPDQFEPNFRMGFIAQCYRYSADPKVREKFKEEWQLWLASLTEFRAKQDRELEENQFEPERSIMGGGNNWRAKRWRGGSYPFNY